MLINIIKNKNLMFRSVERIEHVYHTWFDYPNLIKQMAGGAVRK